MGGGRRPRSGSHGRRRIQRIALPAALLATIAAALPASASAESYSVKTLHFIVTVGPAGAEQQCNIVGDLYKPADATASHPDPSVLTTNGFGGSKADQASLGQELASEGYVVLSYSGLGFGGSGCPIELDDPDWDGKAASQLITFLGGGMAATDGTKVNYVIHDATAHDGHHHAYDPRVGMIGGSYGGEVQFAAAEQDPRLDTIVPIITWNDLTYSLAPNNANLPPTVPGDSVTNPVPGVAKFIWLNAFFGEGAAEDGLQQLANDPTADLTGCPNFNSQVCQAAIETDTTGAPPQSAIALLRHASVESYMSRIRIPTLLAQGEYDTLFHLHEAVSTYESLRRQGTPVKMIWQSWGHSQEHPAPGELGDGSGGYAIYDSAGHITYEGETVQQWFDHYLKGAPAAPSLDFTFFRPWVSYSGDADKAYGRAPSYPIAPLQNLDLSGTNSLVSNPAAVQSGTASFVTPAAGAPTSYSEISAVEANEEPGQEPYDVPGTFAEYQTPPLSQTTDVIGIPSVDVHVSAPVQGLGSPTGPTGDLVLFFKLYDLSPTGYITLPDKLIAPVRVPRGGGTFHVDLPGIVHRFPAGDRIALAIAGGDQAYRGNALPGPVSISTSPGSPGVLHLPVAGPGAYGPVVYASVPKTTLAKPGCPLATGRLTGSKLGPLQLGETRKQAHHALRRSSTHGRRYMDYFCLTPVGIRVGYPAPRDLRMLPPSQRKRANGSVVLMLTSNHRYKLKGVAPGARLSQVKKRLGPSKAIRIGVNQWYLVPDGRVVGVLKVRYGKIQELGLADKRFTHTRRDAQRFLNSFG